ncbi:rrm-containing protein, partial [Gaertneriomyces semiglobifer]
FRLFCGDLGNEVTDELLHKTFSKYPSLLRARVVRDKKTMKSKGYGFVSFKDATDFVKAMKEMNGR